MTSDIKEQLTLPLWYNVTNIYTETTGASCTFTFTTSGAWPVWTRDDILRHNIKRGWAGIGLILMFAIPIIGILLL